VTAVATTDLAAHGINAEDAAYRKIHGSICSFVTSEWLSALEQCYTDEAAGANQRPRGGRTDMPQYQHASCAWRACKDS